jgi:hypothetical protein
VLVVNELRIPAVFAVGLWAASGLAVLTYTVIAFRETGKGLENFSPIGKNSLGLVAAAGTLAAEEIGPQGKQLNRNKFDPSQGALEGLMK